MLLKLSLAFTFIVTFFLVLIFHLYATSLMLLSIPSNHDTTLQHKDAARMVSLQEAVFQDYTSAPPARHVISISISTTSAVK